METPATAATTTGAAGTTPSPSSPAAQGAVGAAPEVDYIPSEDELFRRERPEIARLMDEARTGTLTYATGDNPVGSIAPWHAAGLAVGAFVLVGLLIWGGQRVMNAAGGMTNGLSHGVKRELANDERESGLSRGTPVYRSPAAPGGVPAFSRGIGGGGGAPAAPAPRVGKGPFIGDAERAAAAQSLRPLRDVLQVVQRYESGGLTRRVSPPGAPSASLAAPVTIMPEGGTTPVTLASRSAPATGSEAATRGALFMPSGGGGAGAARAAEADAERARVETEALSTHVNLVTHEEQFPEPLRPAMKEFRKEMHGYLMNKQMIVTGDPADRGALQTGAGRRLARAQALLSYMDGMVAGNTDPNETPMP
jgi:hypothetical protein